MYDFDRMTDRSGTLSYKWDVSAGELPMWVADMDFETVPEAKEALIKRAEHGIFGYTATPDEYFEAISGYFKRRHGFAIPTEWMVYSNGIVAAIGSIIRKLTTPAENVLIQAPVYNIFYNSILNNGRNVLSSDLVYENGEYSIDFSDLEEKLKRPQTSMMILCNPHNPVGRVWTREELVRIGELCMKHGVTVISDEIHCDFVSRDNKYTPFASASDVCAEISITCVSSSKTFNLAGLQSACVCAKNPFIRHKVYRGLNTEELGEPNAFSMQANIAAFNHGDVWISELCDYVFANKRYAESFIAENIPEIYPVHSDATYLLWVDVSKVMPDSVAFCKRLRELTGLYISDGLEYGECSKGFVRINMATQRARVLDGLDRLKRGIDMILAERAQG